MASRGSISSETSQTHLARSLKLAEESKQVGVNTLIKLDEQTEQLRRVRADAEDTEHIIKGNRGVVKDMRRNWMIRLCCYNRSDVLPGDVAWDQRDTPEEQKRVQKMIKLDKRRRMLRRRAAKKGPDDEEGPDQSPGKKDESAKTSWKFWRKGSTFSDDDSDLSDISEESPTGKQSSARILPGNPKTAAPTLTEADMMNMPDEETALDQLENTVQDLKVIAMQISETSKQQMVMLEGVSAQVNTNQVHLDKNQKMVGKLGRRAKDDGDSGILSAQDRLAIMGVKSAFNTRMNG